MNFKTAPKNNHLTLNSGLGGVLLGRFYLAILRHSTGSYSFALGLHANPDQARVVKMGGVALMLELKLLHQTLNIFRKGNTMEKLLNMLEVTGITTPADNSIVLNGFTEDSPIAVKLTRKQCLQIVELSLLTMGIGNEVKALVIANNQR